MILNSIKSKIYRYRRTWRSWYWTRKVKRQCASYKPPLKVNFCSSVTGKTILGTNVNFNGMTVVGGGTVKIGDNFHSGIECRMITQFHRYEDGNAIPYDNKEYVIQNIEIGDNVWLGDRVIILGGVSIGEGAIIQAGSVVVSSIPKYGIAGGHPAKVFKYRDGQHYEKLKSEGKFH